MSISPSAPISAVVRWLAVALVAFTFPLLVLGIAMRVLAWHPSMEAEGRSGKKGKKAR